MKKKLSAAFGIAATTALLLAGCSSSGSENEGGDKGSSSASSFGECEITSKANSIELEMKEPGTLTVGTVLPNPGWWNGDTPESIQSGFEYCMAAEIANMSGASKLKLQNLAWDQYIAGSAKDYDIAIAGTTITDERKQVFDFTVPYFESNLGVATKKDADVSESNLKSKKIGVLQGNMGANYVQETLGVQPQLFQNQADMFTALQAGQVDAVVTDTTLALTSTNASNGALVVVGQIKLDQGYGAVTPKGAANSAALNTAVETLVNDGTTEKLSEKWLKPFFGTDPNSVPFWTVK